MSKKLTKYHNDTLCGIIYIPPENTRYSMNDPFSEIQLELDVLKCDCSNILLFGDFNARTGHQNVFIEGDNFLLQELDLEAWSLNTILNGHISKIIV